MNDKTKCVSRIKQPSSALFYSNPRKSTFVTDCPLHVNYQHNSAILQATSIIMPVWHSRNSTLFYTNPRKHPFFPDCPLHVNYQHNDAILQATSIMMPVWHYQWEIIIFLWYSDYPLYSEKMIYNSKPTYCETKLIWYNIDRW